MIWQFHVNTLFDDMTVNTLFDDWQFHVNTLFDDMTVSR